MPKKNPNNEYSNFRETEQHGMATEEHLGRNETSSSTNQDVPDLTDIEKEEIKDKSDNVYKPELFKKCLNIENKESEEYVLNTLKFILAKKKYDLRKAKYYYTDEQYVVSREWYERWRKFSRYDTFNRIILSAYSKYLEKPIKYDINKCTNPGKINNEILLIKNKKVDDNGRNILVSKFNNCLDTKLNIKKKPKDFILLPKERFDLLNEKYGCDLILKTNKISDTNVENKTYDIFSVHFNIVFIPTLALFKEVTKDNYEEFVKKHKIIYDIYFRQTDNKKEIVNELTNIFKEKSELLSNIGVHLLVEDDMDVLANQMENFTFYIPNEKNTKTINEMMDFIYSEETIEKIKKDEKISEKDINLQTIEYGFDLKQIFRLNIFNTKNNIDDVKNGYFILEYLENQDYQKLSIFESKNNIIQVFDCTEERSVAGSHISNFTNPVHHGQSSYDLDNYPLDKKENRHGLVGLNNLGNTCYMNTGLQCLSNCELLTKYFLEDYYKEFVNKENPIGSQGKIVEKYSQLIHHLWYGNNDCVSPIQFKVAFGKNYNAFADFRQQDSQEFISYLLDALHEDLNKVKNKPYVQAKDLSPGMPEEDQFKMQKDLYLCRNQSFIVDLINGFYKSTVYCPDENCKNISKSFEPFNMITLSLVNEAQLRKLEEFQNEENKKLGIRVLTVTFIPFKINYKPLKFPIKVKKEMDIFSFKKKIEALTGFNKNSFEIYKMQGSEFVPIKPNIIILDEFLNGDKYVYLHQIPPYVFDKPLDYFDKTYNKLNSDHDKYFLEEEKYEGNDLYDEYNKVEKKSKTDDDCERSANRMQIDDKNEDKNDQDIKKKLNKSFDEDIEMKDDSLNINKEKWIKAEFYNYSYSNEKSKDKKNEETRINRSRIVYINKEWDNTQIYLCILEMLEETRNDLEEIKAEWFKDIKEFTKKIGKMEDEAKKSEKNKKKNNDSAILDLFDQTANHPLMLQYLGVYNFNKTNIMKKKENWKNVVFPFDPKKSTIKTIIKSALEKNNELTDIELLFKIIWKPVFAKEYSEGASPLEMEKSEKLEDIFKTQKEDEFLKKNNAKNIKENEGKKKNKKLKLEELLNNFNELEKLTKDNKWFCPKCKQFQLADKKMEIFTINEVVIIHLKRFRNNRKIDNLVEFPIEGLDLGSYLSNKSDKDIYDLFAVANHVGGLHGGHYFAYCKNCIDGEWYEFNDSHVSKIDNKKVVSENAYVLFYKRKREEKINEEELFKKPFINIDISKYS